MFTHNMLLAVEGDVQWAHGWHDVPQAVRLELLIVGKLPVVKLGRPISWGDDDVFF